MTTDKPNSTDHRDLPGTYDPRRDQSETIRTPTKPLTFPTSVPPRSTEHDRGQLAYYGYDVSALLQAGANTVEVRLNETDSMEPPNWPSRIAVDGFATLDSGEEVTLATDEHWLAASGPPGLECSHHAPRDDGERSEANQHLRADSIDHHAERDDYTDSPGAPEPCERGWEHVQSEGPALASQHPLPSLTFRGNQRSSAGLMPACALAACLTFAASLVLLGGGYLVVRAFAGRGGSAISALWVPYWSRILLVASSLIGSIAILHFSYTERDERLWSLEPESWVIAAAAVLAVMVLAAINLVIRAPYGSLLRTPSMPAITRWVRVFPTSTAWRYCIFFLLVFGLVARVYQLDLQPLDDDEYASVQGVLAIAKTGVPGFVPEGVYYSRSPCYHYVAAGFVVIFGENLWALRLPSAILGVATAWLTHLMGATLLRSRWVGFGAMVLILFHPYEVFTSHVARLYQQQQFFALLSTYWFCKGFATSQSQTYRYLAVFSSLATILSQEIAIVMIPQFLIGFILFARDLGWRNNFRLLVCGAICGVLLFQDWLAFQTLCLTRLEGVSPNLEATIRPHFWQPFNLFSIFIGYSRLHVSLSLFIALDLLFGWRTRQRAFLALFILLLAGIVMTNLLVTHTSLRYQYFLFPVWVLLGLEAMRRVVVRLPVIFGAMSASRSQHSVLLACLSGLFFVTVVLSWSPWRMLGTYDMKILPDSTGACRYVAQQMHPDDKVMVTEPHPHAGFLEIGRADYDLTIPLLHDFVVLHDGVLIDRNAGATAINSLKELQRVLREHDRVWILMNKEKIRSRGKNLRWEYPAARVEDYLRRNTELKYRSPFWYVYLWDASVGHQRLYDTDE